MMQLASYVGTRKGIKGLFNVLCRFWLAAKESHTEIVFSDGQCFSCAATDNHGKPRFKQISFDADKWKFINLYEYNEEDTRARATQAVAEAKIKYSYIHLAAFVITPLFKRLKDTEHVCSSVCALVLGMNESQRQSPHSIVLTILN